MERLINMLRSLKEKNFWGAVQVNFKDGNVTHTTLTQTIQHVVPMEGQNVLVIVAQQHS
jgi:hypothetical protein